MIEQYNLSFLNLKSIENVLFQTQTNTHGLLTNGISSFNVGMPILLHQQLKGLYLILQQYVRMYCNQYDLGNFKFINSWFNITEPKSKLKKHNLYVSVGKKSVPLIFTERKIQPYPGLLIIFPSHLDHYTTEEQERRIVMSFNTEFL